MCLDILDKSIKNNHPSIYYKIFKVRYNELHSMYQNTSKVYELNTPYKSEKYQIYHNSNNISYLSGFHVYKRKKDAQRWINWWADDPFTKQFIIKRVKCNHLIKKGKQIYHHYDGTQFLLDVFVFDTMEILS